jgi:flagellar basal-body rod protein FlgG
VQVGQLNLTTFMNDTGLESIGENLYTETQSSGAPCVNRRARWS